MKPLTLALSLLTFSIAARGQCYTLINTTDHPVTLNYRLENGGVPAPPWVSGETLPQRGQAKYGAQFFNVVVSITTPNTIAEGNKRLVLGPKNALPGGPYNLVSTDRGSGARGGGEGRGGRGVQSNSPPPEQNNCLNFQGSWFAERDFTALVLTQNGCNITGSSQNKVGNTNFALSGKADASAATLLLNGSCSNEQGDGLRYFTMKGIISPRENRRLAFQVTESSGGCNFPAGPSEMQILRFILPNGDLVQ